MFQQIPSSLSDAAQLLLQEAKLILRCEESKALPIQRKWTMFCC